MIDTIVGQIETVDGVKLLDVAPGAATNRTVVTFVGSPEEVLEAAVRAITKATELIDMSHHTVSECKMARLPPRLRYWLRWTAGSEADARFS